MRIRLKTTLVFGVILLSLHARGEQSGEAQRKQERYAATDLLEMRRVLEECAGQPVMATHVHRTEHIIQGVLSKPVVSDASIPLIALQLCHRIITEGFTLPESVVEKLFEVAENVIENESSAAKTDIHEEYEEIIALMYWKALFAKCIGDYERAESGFLRFIAVRGCAGSTGWSNEMGYEGLMKTYVLSGKRGLARMCLESMRGICAKKVDRYTRWLEEASSAEERTYMRYF